MGLHKVSKSTGQEFLTQHYSSMEFCSRVFLLSGSQLSGSQLFLLMSTKEVSEGSLVTLHEILGLLKSMENAEKEEFDYKILGDLFSVFMSLFKSTGKDLFHKSMKNIPKFGCFLFCFGFFLSFYTGQRTL